MDMILNVLTQMWRGRVDYEVERQSLRARLYALKIALGGTRRLVLFTLYILLFLYSFFGALTVAVNAQSWAQDLRPFLIYAALTSLFGGVLLYNLREKTWIQRWGLNEKINAFERMAERQEQQGPQRRPEDEQLRDVVRVLERFEQQIESRLQDFEDRQRRELSKITARRSKVLPNGYHRDMDLY